MPRRLPSWLLALASLLVAALAACAPDAPRELALGQEQCGYCRMTIGDPRYAGQARSGTGKVLAFDAIECLASYVRGTEGVTGAWVGDHARPGTWLVADSARFYRLADGRSPMGKGFVAVGDGPPPAGVVNPGRPMRWAEVLAVVGEEGMRQGAHDHAHGAPAAHAAAAAAPDADVVVSPDGPVRTLSEALRRVAPHGRIVVTAGTYAEPATIAVGKPVTIEGRGWPTLDGRNEREILQVLADSVTLRGLRFARVNTMMTEDRAAVRVHGATDCVVEGNRFDDTFFGVYLARSERCRVADNVFVGRKDGESNSGNAIHLWNTRDVQVLRNRITGHRDGIYFEFTRHGRAEGNVSEGNLRYGLHFMYSDSCAYVGNAFRANGAGVAVMYTNVVTMTGNTFADNPGAAAYGLLLKEIAEPTLERNVFARNTVGLMADGTTRLVARHNRFADNGWAVRLMTNVQEGRFEANDFAGNTFDVATNGRDGDGTVFAGNWYDEYRGWDLDRDGRGDVTHRPVRLFSLLVARYEPALVLQRSFFVGLLDAAERVLPALTPETLADAAPAMAPQAAPEAPNAAAARLASTTPHPGTR